MGFFFGGGEGACNEGRALISDRIVEVTSGSTESSVRTARGQMTIMTSSINTSTDFFLSAFHGTWQVAHESFCQLVQVPEDGKQQAYGDREPGDETAVHPEICPR